MKAADIDDAQFLAAVLVGGFVRAHAWNVESLVAVFLLASAEKSPPRKALPPPCEVQCLEAKLAASEKKSVKRLKGWRKAERKAVNLRRVVRARSRGSLWGAFQCIHHYEGAWTSATGNGYFGGLQMDRNFMAHYGGPLLSSLGTANRWPAEAQIAVGIVAFYSGRGFYPWPNTARFCGLIP